MCYSVYTKYQRQGAVVNMTMETKEEFKVVSVWEHKAHGATRIEKIYQLILDQSPGEVNNTDLVFRTAARGKVTLTSSGLN